MDTYLSFLEAQYLPRNIPTTLPMWRRDDVDDLLPWTPRDTPTFDPDRHERTMRTSWTARRAELVRAMYAEPESDHGLEPGDGYALYSMDPAGGVPREMERLMSVAMRVVGLDTTPAPSFQHSSEWAAARDDDVLSDCVMQVEEALVLLLRRQRSNTR